MLKPQLKQQWLAGYRISEARRHDDEGAARWHMDWSRKAIDMSDDKNAEKVAFRTGYRTASAGWNIFDCPYSN